MGKKKAYQWLAVVIIVVLFISIPLTIVLVTKTLASSKYYYFGSYPQTIKADDVQITNTVDYRGYYVGSDAECYAYLDGEYYKVEPIKWHVLKKEKGKMLLHSEYILENRAFSFSDNNYEKSLVRSWLNEDFYERAFSLTEKERVILTAVDNSVNSTNLNKSNVYTTNPYVCENTIDYVFLLSRNEVTNKKYKFKTAGYEDDNKNKMETDYAHHGKIIRSQNYIYYALWLLRSPYCLNRKEIHMVYGSSSITSTNVGISSGIAPAIWIKRK